MQLSLDLVPGSTSIAIYQLVRIDELPEKFRPIDKWGTTATHTKPYEHENPAFNMFNDYIYDQLAALDVHDEYDTYCTAPPLPMEPPHLIQYWDGQAASSPSLLRMALDLLSISAMTAECDHVFSSSKILISDRRNRFKDDIIEASECLNY